MSTIRHCPTCRCQTRHQHLHDTTSLALQTHMVGTERYECIRCGRQTFAWSPGAERFRFVLDGADRQAVSSHAGARR